MFRPRTAGSTLLRQCSVLTLRSHCQSQCFDSLTSGYTAGPIMAGTKQIDFSSGLTYYDTKQFSARRDSVVSTDLSTYDEVDLTHHQQPDADQNQEVKVIVLRDRSGLSLALTKLKCCSELEKRKCKVSFSAPPGCCDSCEKCHQVGSKKNSRSRLCIIYAGLGG